MLHPKYLSRKVHISTVNSTVQFHACIQFAFKISPFFLSHYFDVIDLEPSSRLLGILEYDAINKFNIQIDPSNNSCKIKDTIVPFLNITDEAQYNFLQVHTVTSVYQPQNQSPTPISEVKLLRKIILLPEEHV